MTTPIGALPGKVHDLTTFIQKGRRETVMDMALVAKDEFLAGPPRSGLPKNASLKWGAGFNVKGSTKPTALVRYRGPVHWTNNGTDAHVITPKGFTGSRATRTSRGLVGGNTLSRAKIGRGAAQAVKFNGKVRRVAYHPGTKARPFWPEVQRRTRARSEEVLRVGLRRNIARAGFGAASNIR